MHHMTAGMKRLGHDKTLPLCPWHHRGVVTFGFSKHEMSSSLGPSFAHSRIRFEAEFGTEEQLLIEANARLAA